MLYVDGGLFSRIKSCSRRVFPCPSICWGFFLLSVVESVITVVPLPSICSIIAQAGRGINCVELSTAKVYKCIHFSLKSKLSLL